MCFHSHWALPGPGGAEEELLTWNRWGTKGTVRWSSSDPKGRDHTYKNSALTDGFLSWCSTLDPAYRGEQSQPSEPAQKIAPCQCYISCDQWEIWENCHAPHHHSKTQCGYWFQMPGIKDGGNKEEASCGAGTGMQMYSLTRWFLLVGVWSAGGQFRGALTYACKQVKDFDFYCFLSRKQQNSLKSPFCPTVWKGSTAIWWWVRADSCQSARSDQLLNPKWWCQSFKQEEEKLCT